MASASSLAIVCAVIVLPHAAAHPHDGDATSSPADGETVDIGDLHSVEIVFDEAATDPRVELLGPDGERIPGDLTTPDKYSVILSFDALADTGNYQLRWFAQAADGHPITGAATFSVGEDTDPSGGTRLRDILLVALGSAGLVAAVGRATRAARRESR